MNKRRYKIRFLSSFSDELNEILYYIAFILKNQNAAERLLDDVMNSIQNRSNNPEGYEIYKEDRKYDWYRIYIRNFVVFYIVRDNVMEVAHIIYSARNMEELI
jgi:plasmid stabilization system protein ParE